ncbi:helix-turn-helix domain-containing protein [Empedobacter brevis]|uniref:winged helix-turn-helix transcriptional regulator n=1 Tax=Empedobacter brevis TaxID=247 RepID=UPI0028D86988|nr:helix-turn-helix domain-containing protein [Empedobacter brevis]
MAKQCTIIKKQSSACKEQLLALRDGLEILGGKWKLLILLYLDNRKKEQNHFKKMQREIIGISAKMLTKELRDLEMNFMITRNVQTEPYMVFYALTDYGKTAIKISKDITKWGLIHRQKIKNGF